jgi:hypothetical protein
LIDRDQPASQRRRAFAVEQYDNRFCSLAGRMLQFSTRSWRTMRRVLLLVALALMAFNATANALCAYDIPLGSAAPAGAAPHSGEAVPSQHGMHATCAGLQYAGFAIAAPSAPPSAQPTPALIARAELPRPHPLPAESARTHRVQAAPASHPFAFSPRLRL